MARIKTGSKRTFSNKKFSLKESRVTKRDAVKRAKTLRAKGYHVRIIKRNIKGIRTSSTMYGPTQYLIYIRKS